MISFKGPPVPVNYTGQRRLTVTVLDHRPSILKYEKPLNFVGIIRGGYGNPFDLTTESGEPFADALLYTVTESLKAKGFPVTPISNKPEAKRKSVLKDFRSSGSDRLLLITVDEWQNDYYPASFSTENSHVLFDVELEVFNTEHKIVAKEEISGECHLPSGWPNETIPRFYQQKISELLNAPKIAAALK